MTVCEDVRLALTGELLRPGIASEVRIHLEGCADCRRFIAEQRRRPERLRALAPEMDHWRSRTMLEHLRDVLRSLVGRS